MDLHVSPSDDTTNERTQDESTARTTADTLPQRVPRSKPIGLTDLPAELVHDIVQYLQPVDRVALALTCKSSASAVLSAPRLCPARWPTFHNLQFDCQLPRERSLLHRLADGWIPRERVRYCAGCRKILPRRDEIYWLKRLNGNKKEHAGRRTWTVVDKLGRAFKTLHQDTTGKKKKERYRHSIERWSARVDDDKEEEEEAVGDGTSVPCCDYCRPQPEVLAARHHVLCPLCEEDSMRRRRRRPGKPWSSMRKLSRLVELLWLPVELCTQVFCSCGENRLR
jgi:hypothetical protein